MRTRRTSLLDPILDQEFERLRDKYPALKTDADRAKFLNMSVGYYSRVRGLKVPMTDKLAKKIAAKLHEESQGATSLAQRLLAAGARSENRDPSNRARSSKPESGDQATFNLLARLSHPRAALFVCYSSAHNASLYCVGGFQRRLLEAVKAGMRLVMVQPFGPLEKFSILDQENRVSEFMSRLYARRVSRSVRDYFLEIRKALPASAKGNVILLESREIDPSNKFIPGAQLFRAVFQPPDHRMRGDEMYYCLDTGGPGSGSLIGTSDDGTAVAQCLASLPTDHPRLGAVQEVRQLHPASNPGRAGRSRHGPLLVPGHRAVTTNSLPVGFVDGYLFDAGSQEQSEVGSMG